MGHELIIGQDFEYDGGHGLVEQGPCGLAWALAKPTNHVACFNAHLLWLVHI